MPRTLNPDFPIEDLALGDTVWYYDQDRWAHPAIVTAIRQSENHHDKRPLLNLAVYMDTGRTLPRERIYPAEFCDDTQRHLVLCRWSLPSELPQQNEDGTPVWLMPEIPIPWKGSY